MRLAKSITSHAVKFAALCGSLVIVTTTAPAADNACAKKTELLCVLSKNCILEPAGKKYADYWCRKPANHCERDFAQIRERAFPSHEALAPDPKAVCNAKTGCVYAPGRCYCPPNVDCKCGGGEPPNCRVRQSG